MASFRYAKRILVATVVMAALMASACRSDPVAVGADLAPTAEPKSTVAATVAPTSSPEATPTAMTDPTPGPAEPRPPTPAPTPTAAPATITDLVAMSRLEPTDCPADVRAAQVSCSVATLPRNIDAPRAGETVELMVALVDNGDPNDVGPVVFLQGGPGVGSVTRAPNFVGAGHDLLFVDQRGSGYSTPKLNCPEVDDLWEAQFSDDPDVRLSDDGGLLDAAYVECARRLLSEGISFDDFNTKSAATDIELVRQLFGYDEWTLWGISYGARMGLTIMRDHPDGVRSAVLDSIVPFEVDFFATIPENGLRAIAALDAACDAGQCTGDHGDFFENLSDLVLRLNDDPVVVTATRPGSGETFPFRVDGKELVNMVFTQLYSTRSLRSLPRQIARADYGGFEEMVANYVTGRDPTRFDLSIALYYTTWCHEEFPFYDPSADDVLLDDLAVVFGDAVTEALSSDGLERLCKAFAVAPSDPVDDEPLISDIPTLVFAGAFDPITPPAWSRQVADRLTNASYVEMADHGHGMATACPATIRLSFLQDPLAQVDTTCADQTGGPDFD